MTIKTVIISVNYSFSNAPSGLTYMYVSTTLIKKVWVDYAVCDKKCGFNSKQHQTDHLMLKQENKRPELISLLKNFLVLFSKVRLSASEEVGIELKQIRQPLVFLT